MQLTNAKKIGNMLKEIRIKKGLTLEQMAKERGLSIMTIQRLENGKLGYVHERTASALGLKRIFPENVTKDTGDYLPSLAECLKSLNDQIAKLNDKLDKSSVYTGPERRAMGGDRWVFSRVA